MYHAKHHYDIEKNSIAQSVKAPDSNCKVASSMLALGITCC